MAISPLAGSMRHPYQIQSGNEMSAMKMMGPMLLFMLRSFSFRFPGAGAGGGPGRYSAGVAGTAFGSARWKGEAGRPSLL